MKRFSITPSSLSVLFFILLIAGACKKTSIPYTQDGNWVSRSSLNGPNRGEAIVFVIGNYAYLGTGIDQTNRRYNDLWQYDQTNDNWVQMANMPDTNRKGGTTGRNSAVAFAVGSQGYVGTGYDGYFPMNDFWQYDAATNSWKQIADFAGSARYDAVAFGIGDYGYLSTGYDGSNAQKDFWRYDPSADAWSQQVSMGGDKRSGAVAFVYDNKGYIVTGVNSGSYVNDFWVFDPTQDPASSWKQLRHITNFTTDTYDDGYTNIIRSNAAAFVIGDFAYLSTGNGGALYQYTWEYDIKNDLWKQKASYEGAAREGAVGFTINNRGYLGTGKSSSATFDDIREFHPNEAYNAND